MANSPRRTKRDRIVDATLALAGEQRWADVTLSAIAGKAGLPLAALRREFSGRGAILAAFFDRIDAEMLAEVDAASAEEEPRDRIFDIMMRRFDALAPHKPAIASIARGLAGEPLAALAMGARVMRVQRWTLDAAGIATDGPRGRLRIKGLAALYARTLRTWLDEDDPGMPRTMATLDRGLRSGERWLDLLAAPMALAEACAGVAAAIARRGNRFGGAAAADGPAANG